MKVKERPNTFLNIPQQEGLRDWRHPKLVESLVTYPEDLVDKIMVNVSAQLGNQLSLYS